MRRAGLPLPDDPHHFFQLFAQALVGMEPARGIHEHRVDPARDASVDGIESDGCRVGPLPRTRANERHVEPLGPDPELLGRAGAKGVGGGQQHAAAFGFETMRAWRPWWSCRSH